MDRTLQTIGLVLLIGVLFGVITIAVQQYMNIPVIDEIHSYVARLFGWLVPSYNLTVEAINGQLIEGTRTVHYYVENFTSGKVDIAKITLETDKSLKLVIEVKTDIENASLSATITDTNAVVIKDVEQISADTYLLKIEVHPVYESSGSTVPESVESVIAEVTIVVSADIPAGATGYVSVRVAEATYI